LRNTRDDARSRDSDDVPMPEFLRVLYSSAFQVLALFWSALICVDPR